VAYVRTVKTASGARAVQIVHGSRRGARRIEHLGSAHDDLELEALKASARQRLAGEQNELDLGLDTTTVAAIGSAPLPITSSQMSHLWQGLGTVYDALGFDRAVGGDEVFRQLVLARIIEPTSKQDSLRVLAEAAWGRRRIPRSTAAYRPTRRRSSGRSWPPRARRIPRWVRRRW
jgi:hypothetical protein